MTKNETLALAEAARLLGEEAAKVDPVCGYLASQITLALREAAGDIAPAAAKGSADPGTALKALAMELAVAVS